MLKSLFRLLNKDLTGKTWEVEATHPYFGNIVYYGNRDGGKSYWESELNVDGDIISVGINSSTEDLPGDEHVHFVQDLLANPDQTFQLVAQHIAPVYKEYTGEDLPDAWQAVLRLEALFVPQDCDRNNPWELSYGNFGNEDGYQYTCHFFPDRLPSISVTD